MNTNKYFISTRGLGYEVQRADLTGWRALFEYAPEPSDGPMMCAERQRKAAHMARRFRAAVNKQSQQVQGWDWLNYEPSEEMLLDMRKDCCILKDMLPEVLSWQSRLRDDYYLDYEVHRIGGRAYLRVDLMFAGTVSLMDRVEFCVADYNTTQEALDDMREEYQYLLSTHFMEKEECNG